MCSPVPGARRLKRGLRVGSDFGLPGVDRGALLLAIILAAVVLIIFAGVYLP